MERCGGFVSKVHVGDTAGTPCEKDEEGFKKKNTGYTGEEVVGNRLRREMKQCSEDMSEGEKENRRWKIFAVCMIKQVIRLNVCC